MRLHAAIQSQFGSVNLGRRAELRLHLGGPAGLPTSDGAPEQPISTPGHVNDIINECIRDQGPYSGYKGAFSRIVDPVVLELELQGAAWRAHMQGSLSFWRRPRPPFYQFQFVFM
ncbi:hypothetical protein MY11210_000257 [Beauveria gryllotalpidicola]